MSRSHLSWRVLRLLALVLVGLGTLVAGVLFSQSATRRLAAGSESGPAPATDQGAVCFGSVDLEQGTAALAPLTPGRVAEVLVHENQTVAAGTVLVRLEDGLARSRVTEAEAALEAARAQLAQARKGPATQRSRVKQQQDAVEAMSYRLSAARRLVERREQLLASQLVSPEELAISKDQVKELEALARAERQRLDDLQTQDPAEDVRRAEKEVTVLQARLEQARLGVEECRLKAPKAGMVLRVLVGPGDVVGGVPRQPAVLFAADGPQVVRAEVEQEFAGRVAEGQAVVVQDEADPDRTWHGHVKRIAKWYSQRRSVLYEPFQMNDVRTVECLVALDPGQPPLRIGQRVRVLIGPVKP